MKRITKNLMATLLVLTFVQVTLSQSVESYRQSFQSQVEPPVTNYERVCEPRPTGFVRFLNVLAIISSRGQELSTNRRTTRILQYSGMFAAVGQELTSGRIGSFSCYNVPITNIPVRQAAAPTTSPGRFSY